LKRCSNKECCKQCRYVMFKGTMTKWPVQKLTQGTTQKLLQHNFVHTVYTYRATSCKILPSVKNNYIKGEIEKKKKI